MGKGDRRSRRGKIFRGTFGKSRKHKIIVASVAPKAAPVAEAEVKAPAPKKKAPRKKAE